MPERTTISSVAPPVPVSPEVAFSDEALLLTDPPPPGRQAPRMQPIAGAPSIEAVTRIERLEELQAEWQELGDAAAEANPFYEPWMLIPAIRAFGDPDRLRVLFVFAPHPSRAKGKSLLLGVF